ncbi:MAG: S-methyl-5-thioribose-1-phosphate isomerase [Isosphaeraceae bacterium]
MTTAPAPLGGSKAVPSDLVSEDTVSWRGDAASGCVHLIDQTRLPAEYLRIDCRDVPTVWEAIKSLRVRGAAGDRDRRSLWYASRRSARAGRRGRRHTVAEGSGLPPARCARADRLPSTCSGRLDRIDRVVEEGLAANLGPGPLLDRVLAEARAIEAEDRAMCRAIGSHGAALLDSGQGVLTHCNAGGLATADYGTALAVMFAASEQGKVLHVYADETRPLLQGARLTAWELQRRGIPVTLICDNMAAQVMKEGRVQAVVVGADRIAANGDTANKIGTYGVAILARAHGIPFYVAAPSSTFDLSIADGSQIPIEQRDPAEVTHGFGRATAPEGITVYNPAFDVTPASLITGIITERGLIRPVDAPTIRSTLGG